MNLLWVFLVFIFIYSVMGLDLQNTQTGETLHYTWTPWEAIAMGFKYLGMVVSAIAALFRNCSANRLPINFGGGHCGYVEKRLGCGLLEFPVLHGHYLCILGPYEHASHPPA